MKSLSRLLSLVRPYKRFALTSLLSLGIVVVLDLAIPRLVQHIIDDGVALKNQGTVLKTAAVMLVLSLVSTVFAIINSTLSIRVGEGVSRDLRAALFRKIQSFSYGNLDEQQTGQLMVRLTSDVAAVKQLVQVFLRIGTRGPLLMLGSIVLMVRTSSQLALSLLPLMLITIVVIAAFVVRMEPFYNWLQQKLDALNTVLQENIVGIRLVKAFVRSDFEQKRFAKVNRDFTEQSIRVLQFMSLLGPVLTMFVNLGMVVVIGLGGIRTIRGQMSVGQIVAFTNYLLTAMTPLIMMSLLSQIWAAGGASLRRIEQVFVVNPLVQDQPESRETTADLVPEIEFRGVDYSYPSQASELVLQTINLHIRPGTTVAILGATGSGKTTLVNLVPRFYDVTKGQVLVGGVDVRAVKHKALLASVAIVPQQTILFSGTIRENVSYGRPEASLEEVIEVCKMAQAHEFIAALPKQYDARIEERGTNLSGGQKQRIAIARALLVRPKILILDDSTSAVDVATETSIHTALNSVFANATKLLVAQRISTVLNADQIVVLNKGRIVGVGVHRELLQNNEIYREIYDSQLGARPDAHVLEPMS